MCVCSFACLCVWFLLSGWLCVCQCVCPAVHVFTFLCMLLIVVGGACVWLCDCLCDCLCVCVLACLFGCLVTRLCEVLRVCSIAGVAVRDVCLFDCLLARLRPCSFGRLFGRSFACLCVPVIDRRLLLQCVRLSVPWYTGWFDCLTASLFVWYLIGVNGGVCLGVGLW